MNTKEQQLLKSIEKVSSDTSDLLSSLLSIPQMDDRQIREWQQVCNDIPIHLKTGILKIAVVGVIKSGKSTFINSYLGKDRVKRGAGVVTSITTRIRKANQNRAYIYLKSWDEINEQIKKALSLFPMEDGSIETITNFDLRRKKDRDFLTRALTLLTCDFPVTEEGIRSEAVVIQNALEGYDSLKDIVKADESVLKLFGKDFNKHQAYTSDPVLAFYIKDVLLEVFSKVLDSNVEIADCQGSDSTDPGQLFKIIDYVKSANLIIYCVSSRTGLRQSDMRFLKVISSMGLLNNLLLVNNCDLSEHDNLQDLKKIEQKIKQELVFFNFEPRVYSFSALFNLFKKVETSLLSRNRQRFEFWKKEKQMTRYCMSNTNQFNETFQNMLTKDRFDLVFHTHVEKLGLILSGIGQKADMFLELLSSDESRTKEAIQNFKSLQENAARLESIVANSLDGAVKGLIKEIKSNIDMAFVKEKPQMLERIKTFIAATPIPFEQYRPIATTKGFGHIIYLMFQDFGYSLDLFLVQEIIPEFKAFAQRQERKIEQYFQSLSDSYQVDLFKAHGHMANDLCKLDKQLQKQKMELIGKADIKNIKKILGIDLPGTMISTQYTPAIKASVLTGFGMQTLKGMLAWIIQKKSSFSFSPALQRAAKNIKKENLKRIQQQLDAYQANLKEHYFLPLIAAVKREFTDKITQRFNLYDSFVEHIEEISALNQSEKQDQKQEILAHKRNLAKIETRLKTCKPQVKT